MQKIVSFLTAIVMTLSGFFFPGSSGQIYLLGESHGDSSIMAVELETWDRYYQQGMRHLFIEWPYYDAEFLNLWMQAEDDAILTQLFEDMANTAAAQPIYWDYWHTFKEKYPETVFHGTDIGHTYQNSGPRYLRYLEQTGQKDSEAYRITLEVIEQGRAYYEDHGGSYAFREPLMVHNFQRAYDALPAGTSIMGIYGAAHTNPGDTVEGTSDPNMASQLQEIYGDRLHTTDLTAYTIDDSQAGQTQPVTIGGQDFTAVQVLRAVRQSTGESYTYWLVPDAYTAALGQPRNETFSPISNFPTALEVGQVFLYDHRALFLLLRWLAVFGCAGGLGLWRRSGAAPNRSDPDPHHCRQGLHRRQPGDHGPERCFSPVPEPDLLAGPGRLRRCEKPARHRQYAAL